MEPAASPPRVPFTEKGFYLEEFRGRTLAFAAPQWGAGWSGRLRAVLDELVANGTRSLVLASDADWLRRALGLALGDAGAPNLEGEVWRALGASAQLGLPVPEVGFGAACRAVVSRLGIHKLVWIDAEGGLTDSGGAALSFVDLAELRALGPRAGLRGPVLAEIEALLEAGVAAVNLCTPEGLADELFTYAGSGTLFTRDRYMAVRRLSIDDYDAAHDLVSRGIAEGYLAPRSSQEVDRVLASGFGAFVEGRHLAGLGALLRYDEAGAGEIACLYTLTRFLGEGVGAHLVGFALERARALALDRVFACTTQERVGRFFEDQGFVPVGPEQVPAARWEGYDPVRRRQLRCYQRALSAR